MTPRSAEKAAIEAHNRRMRQKDVYKKHRAAVQEEDKVSRSAGKGSRKHHLAGEKATSAIHEGLRSAEQKKKDFALVAKYGEDAPAARSFGTDRGLSEEQLRSSNRKAFSRKKAKGGYVKKYANGGSVRAARF